MNLKKSIQGSLHLSILLVNILGRDLPVGFGTIHLLPVDPLTALVAVLTVHVVPSPADDDQERQSFSLIKTILTLCFLDQLPYVMHNCRKTFAPF